MPLNLIGLSAFYHESACCLLQDGTLIAAAAEERFSRVKHDARLPVEAFRFCLKAGRISITDIDALAYYESPTKKGDRQHWAGRLTDSPSNDAIQPDAEWPFRMIRERLGYDGPILVFDHHQSHAASAFFYSGFAEAATFTADGVGEWATTTYGIGRGATLNLFEEVRFPHSLGLLYATLTAYLGFRVNNGEYKVMGLASYGQPRMIDQIRTLVTSAPDGQYRLQMLYFDYVSGRRMYAPPLTDLLGAPPREPGTPITAFHCDVAKSLQTVLEELLLEKIEYLHRRVDVPNLCLAGGVALNAVANGRIRREGPFERLFIQPASGDAGACLGAAALAHIQITGSRNTKSPLSHVYLGPSWSSDQIETILIATGLPALDYRQRETDLLDAVVARLLENQVIGWFQGAMEFGPRALGARSILANPQDPEAQNRLNRMIKQRESFRPFAPSVLEKQATDHFDLAHPSPFMLETCQVVSPLAIPAVRHVDGSARPQTVNPDEHPRYANLLDAFYRRTGCPMLVNTSFNVQGEPIVCSPIDALLCMGMAGLDALVLGDFLIDRSLLPENWPDLFTAWRQQKYSIFSENQSSIQENLYTFV
jgi:carbamoyltransferase